MKVYRNLFTALCVFTITVMCVSMGSASQVIQTQYGSNGLEVDLIRVKKSGKYLTVMFNCRAAGEENVDETIRHSEVYFLDEEGSKKYHVLKDSKDEWLAINGRSSFADAELSPGESQIIWYKFPLPPENVKTISFHLGQISPFDPVEIEL